MSFGHYWIYIFDFKENIWRKYNDEYVTKVQNLDDIYGNPGGTNPPTPYFLVYIHSNMKDRLVDPVHRDIVQPSTANDAQSAMEDIVSTNPADADKMDLTADQSAPKEPLVSVSEDSAQQQAS